MCCLLAFPWANIHVKTVEEDDPRIFRLRDAEMVSGMPCVDVFSIQYPFPVASGTSQSQE